MQTIATQGEVSFRPVEDTDRDFLFALFADTRRWESAYRNWSEENERAFLKQQFEAQDLSYRTNHPGGAFQIIQLDKVDVGRLYVDRPDAQLHIIDVTIAPDFRSRGIGTNILLALMNEAQCNKIPVRLSVQHQNQRALALYVRLGFQVTGDDGIYYQLEWRSNAGPPGEI